MLAGIHRGKSLLGMHACGCRQDDGIDVVHGEALRQIGAGMRDAVFRRQFLRRFKATADHRCNLDTFDQLQRIKVLLSKGAAAGKTDFHEVNSVTLWW